MKSLSRYSESALPTRRGEFNLVVYRNGDDPKDEHLAMVHGDVRDRQDVLCRVHSECLTGEALGSLRCDCREQLDVALQRIVDEKCGVLVYLRQEGRGIGLGNKVRAYALQDQGIDTVDANIALGFDADLRTYEMAAAILGDLGVGSVRLMTNNPGKLQGLQKAGIQVTRHEPHWVEAGARSADYLEVKKNKMGHLEASPDDGQSQTLSPPERQPHSVEKDASGQ